MSYRFDIDKIKNREADDSKNPKAYRRHRELGEAISQAIRELEDITPADQKIKDNE